MTIEYQPQTHQQRRRFSTCYRHPDAPVTGFCALCLQERLSGLDSTDVSGNVESPSCSMVDLRRCKSYSGNRFNRSSSKPVELHRKSCDARNRNSLRLLFDLDDERNVNRDARSKLTNLGLTGTEGSVVEESEKGRVLEEDAVLNADGISSRNAEVETNRDLRTMKEHIDLEWRSKRTGARDLKKNFWLASSVFSKKLQIWRHKRKTKKHGCSNLGAPIKMVREREIEQRSLKLHETQSEVGEHGFGTNSCDIDPRLPVDAGRVSMDGPRIFLDESRASWDGYRIKRAMPSPTPSISVVENGSPVMVAANKPNLMNHMDESPGGTEQTREYYLDSSSRHRRSFDRSTCLKKAGLLNVDELKPISNAKVSPTTVEFFHGAKLLTAEGELGDSKLKSCKDDCIDRIELSSKFAGSVEANGGEKGSKKFLTWHRVWTMWSLILKGSGSKYKDVDSLCDESCVKMENDGDLEVKGTRSHKVTRTNSFTSVSSGTTAGSSGRKKKSELKGKDDRRKDKLEHNQIARYSPNHLDNGLLRFYLTPLRSKSKRRKSRLKNSEIVLKER